MDRFADMVRRRELLPKDAIGFMDSLSVPCECSPDTMDIIRMRWQIMFSLLVKTKRNFLQQLIPLDHAMNFATSNRAGNERITRNIPCD